MAATLPYTTSNGRPVANPQASQRIGKNGPLLLQDFHLIDLLAHFDRERIPERVVHAKGAGAYGVFEVTHDITDVTSADLFSEIGKKTDMVVRFSTVGGEKGSADSARDPRGVAFKFYTEQGNLDWVFNNTPVFFIRDPSLFPLFIHTQKRNPQTNLKDATMFWDYLSTHEESVHQVMTLFSDRGTPKGYRHLNAYSGHTYKFSKTNGEFVYAQIHVKTDQGIENFTNEEATQLAATNPDFATQDLFESIQKGNFPTWTVYIQVLEPKQVENFRWNVFDLTKVWPQAEVPLRPVGKITLNRNPQNYFAEIEQVAFSPAHTVPGFSASADPVLQARLFSYADSQRHRLGTNYTSLPVNRAKHVHNPFQRDGPMMFEANYGAEANYPSTYAPIPYLAYETGIADEEHENWVGKVTNIRPEVTDEDFVQPKGLWDVLGTQPGQQENFINNVAGSLSGAEVVTRKRTYVMFGRVDKDLGRRLEEVTEAAVKAAA